MIDEQNFFDQPVRNNLIRYDSIQKIPKVQGDDYTVCYLLDYNYFKNYYKMIAIDLSKQLNELKLRIKNGTEVPLKISSNVVGDSNDKNNFQHKLLLINIQVSKLHKTFANGSSANIKVSKTQVHKIGQSGGFLGRPLGPLLKTGLPLIGNVLKPLAKRVLILLGLTAAASATDPAIHKKVFRSGVTTLIISNEEINDIVKIINSLEESSLLMKGVSKAIKNKAKEQNGGFLGMLLGILGASLLENVLTGKYVQLEQMKAQLEQVRIFNAASSLKKF